MRQDKDINGKKLAVMEWNGIGWDGMSLPVVLPGGDIRSNLLQSRNHCFDRSVAFITRFRVQLSTQIYR